MNPTAQDTKPRNDSRDFSSRPSNNLTEMTQGLGKQVGSAVSQFSDSASDMYNKGYNYVKTNPLKGVAIAALTGVVAGSILSRIRN